MEAANTPQSVCLVSNSSDYTSSSAAAIQVETYSDGRVYSCIPLDPMFACTSTNSTAFNGVFVLFISLGELAMRDRETIEFNLTSANGNTSVEFSLNHGL